MRLLYVLSDFGLEDTYVAQMKTAIYCRTPVDTRIVDLTHTVGRGNVSEGAFHLWASFRRMPPGSVVVAVVDPGVGTDRRAIVCRSGGILLVGPDNGLFSLLSIENAWHIPKDPMISSTFHGRDIFAPAGATLITDPGWVDNLRPIDADGLCSIGFEPPRVSDGRLEVTVAHVDHFGNLLLWMDPDDFRDFRPGSVMMPEGIVKPLEFAETYGSSSGLLYLENSQGCMELALCGRSAAEELKLSAGDRLILLDDHPGGSL